MKQKKFDTTFVYSYTPVYSTYSPSPSTYSSSTHFCHRWRRPLLCSLQLCTHHLPPFRIEYDGLVCVLLSVERGRSHRLRSEEYGELENVSQSKKFNVSITLCFLCGAALSCRRMGPSASIADRVSQTALLTLIAARYERSNPQWLSLGPLDWRWYHDRMWCASFSVDGLFRSPSFEVFVNLNCTRRRFVFSIQAPRKRFKFRYRQEFVARKNFRGHWSFQTTPELSSNCSRSRFLPSFCDHFRFSSLPSRMATDHLRVVSSDWQTSSKAMCMVAFISLMDLPSSRWNLMIALL